MKRAILSSLAFEVSLRLREESMECLSLLLRPQPSRLIRVRNMFFRSISSIVKAPSSPISFPHKPKVDKDMFLQSELANFFTPSALIQFSLKSRMVRTLFFCRARANEAAPLLLISFRPKYNARMYWLRWIDSAIASAPLSSIRFPPKRRVFNVTLLRIPPDKAFAPSAPSSLFSKSSEMMQVVGRIFAMAKAPVLQMPF
mmetsp:Transcript_38631/g.71399  ORF Transcript_38631/g.71399 Transcript_38631/m.71399 type:complete len:200 (+) Transcript_38631:1597-2196(+)